MMTAPVDRARGGSIGHALDRAFLAVIAEASLPSLVVMSHRTKSHEQWKRIAIARAIQRIIRKVVPREAS